MSDDMEIVRECETLRKPFRLTHYTDKILGCVDQVNGEGIQDRQADGVEKCGTADPSPASHH